MEIYTSQFEFAHRKKPRGRGRWAFAENWQTTNEKLLWIIGYFGVAKRMAVAHAKAHGWMRLEVRP